MEGGGEEIERFEHCFSGILRGELEELEVRCTLDAISSVYEVIMGGCIAVDMQESQEEEGQTAPRQNC